MSNDIKYVDAEALTWDYLKRFHCYPPDETFPRCNKVIDSYKQHREQVLNKYNSISDYIKYKYFTDKNTKHMYFIVENEFPYKLEPNIKHLICWFNPNYFPYNYIDLNKVPAQINIIIKHYNKKLHLGANCIYFENNIHARSVPGIRHIHIFINTLML
jgi:hypothetical protein